MKKMVFVGLSGGVDSSVAAALLKDQGYDVTGIFIKVWDAPWLPCNWREERRSAMRAAAHLRIPFKTLDLEEEYKNGVVDYMVREYAAGRIPNPDVMCNKVVKFGGFADWAFAQGADYIATGHYAQTNGPGENAQLLTAVDVAKEQSYFLWNMPRKALERTLLPIGHLPKSEVRKYASEKKLLTATKKDSQGLCFLGPVDISTFLKHYVHCAQGDVLDTDGVVVGDHDGALLYTIGQRHGFRVSALKKYDGEPMYVVSKDMEKNTITVARRAEEKTLAQGVILDGVNELTPWSEGEYGAVIRYHGERIPSRLVREGGIWRIYFGHPAADVALGQSCVIYKDNVCFGGSIIDKVI